MKHFLIGAGGHCKSLLSCAAAQNIKIDGVIDSSPKEQKVLNCNVVDEKLHNWDKNNKYLIAVRDQALKKSILKKIKNNIDFPNFFNLIHPSAVVSNGVNLGNGICILAGAYVGPETKIGDHVCINSGCVIEHDCKIGDSTFFGPSVNLAGNVLIGKNCFLGLNASIIENISIADNTVIGSSSLVLKDIKDKNGTFFGIPAKEI